MPAAGSCRARRMFTPTRVLILVDPFLLDLLLDLRSIARPLLHILLELVGPNGLVVSVLFVERAVRDQLHSYSSSCAIAVVLSIVVLCLAIRRLLGLALSLLESGRGRAGICPNGG